MKAQASARVDVPSVPHFYLERTKESNTCVQMFSVRMLGYVHDGRHDLVSVIPEKKEREKEKQHEEHKSVTAVFFFLRSYFV